MAALSFVLPLVIVLMWIQASLADDATVSTPEYPRLIITPDMKGRHKELFVGDTFSFTCTFEAKEGDQHTKAEELNWTDDYRTVIHNRPTENIFSKTLSGKVRRMQLLTLKPDPSSLGKKTFWCRAKYGETNIEKSVDVKMFALPMWKDKDAEVTGRLNERLEINCDAQPANSGAHVDVVFTFENNTALPDSYPYEASSSRLVIKNLTMDQRNAVIRCTAIEVNPAENVAMRTDKTVRINLQFPPVFAHKKLKRYGILGRTVSLPCQVIDGNPRVGRFQFHVGGNQLKDDGDKYLIDEDLQAQTATLKINNLVDTDFKDKYYCQAISEENAYTDKEMEFTLQQALPPGAPEVTFKQASRREIRFEIKDIIDKTRDDPPVTRFEIRSFNFNDVKHLEESDRREKLKEAEPKLFNKTDNNMYTVSNLHWNTAYIFDIRAVSEAGSSDAVILNASTLDQNAPEAITGGGTAFVANWWCIVASIAFAVAFNSLWPVGVYRH